MTHLSVRNPNPDSPLAALSSSVPSASDLAGRPAAEERLLPRLRRSAAWALFLVFPLAAQSPQMPLPPSITGSGGHPASHGPDSGFGMGEGNEAMQARRIKELNILRQRSIVEDVNKLLRLARELNNDIDGDSDVQLAGRSHKASEIEKLAKDIKNKMTYAITPLEDARSQYEVEIR